MEKRLEGCGQAVCRDLACDQAVKQAPTGRWYITMGHAGFNSTANNGAGYETVRSARMAWYSYSGKTARMAAGAC